MIVAVAGATSLVGAELLRVLDETRALEVTELRPLGDAAEVDPQAKPPEEGEDDAEERVVDFREEELPVVVASERAFEGAAVAFLTGTAEQAGRMAKLSFPRVPLTVDLSGRFAGDGDVPLVLPGLNDLEATTLPKPRALVAVPDPATSMVALALAPIERAFGVERVVATVLEAASGAGRAGMDALGVQIRDLFNYRAPEGGGPFPRAIAFNAIPQVDDLAGADTKSEQALARGVARLLGRKGLDVTATRAWVPAFSGHSASVTVDVTRPATMESLRAALDESDAVEIRDEDGDYPVNGDAVGGDELLVGRLRVGADGKRLTLWLAADNLRLGGAAAAVAVAKLALGV